MSGFLQSSSASGGGPAGSGGVTYFVDGTTGSDSNNGLSPATAFKTVIKANSIVLLPGQSMLFKGGETFSGAIVDNISPLAGPSANITYGSYGGSQATISSGNSDGFLSDGKSGIIVRDLTFSGSASTNHGILFTNSQSGNIHLQNVQIINCNVSGYGGSGIFVTGVAGYAGYDDVLIDGCTVFNCATVSGFNLPMIAGLGGITVSSNSGYGLSTNGPSFNNVLIRNCIAHDNAGVADNTTLMGNGISIGQAANFLVKDCLAYNNGGSGGGTVGGPIGIFAQDFNNGKFINCRSFSNASGSGQDGAGFDMDGGSVNGAMQDCLSYNNFGYGFGLIGLNDGKVTATTGCALINCKSYGDCTGGVSGHSSIFLHNDSTNAAAVTGLKIFGNTAVQTNSGVGALSVTGANSAGITGQVADNSLTVSTTQNLVNADHNPSSLALQGNRYYGAFNISWNGTGYTDIATWALATGQEIYQTGLMQSASAIVGSGPYLQIKDTETNGADWWIGAEVNSTHPTFYLFDNTNNKTDWASNFDGNGSFSLRNSAAFAWAASANFADSTFDTGISRDSAAVIDFGNGTPQDKSAFLNARAMHLSSSLNEQDLLIDNTTHPSNFNVRGTTDGTQISGFSNTKLSDGSGWTFSLRDDGSFLLYHFNGVSTFINLLRSTPAGSLVLQANGALATNATDGFTYIPTCAGTPTGTPTTQTGAVPIVYDTTNNQFWIYAGGAWKQPKTPAGAAIVNWQ